MLLVTPSHPFEDCGSTIILNDNSVNAFLIFVCVLFAILETWTSPVCNTVIFKEPYFLEPSVAVAVTVAVQALSPVTFPLSSTVAIVELLLFHVTALIDALAGSTSAFNFVFPLLS